MNEYFESIKKGAKEALAWKQGQKASARVHQYKAMDVTKIRKNANMTQKEVPDLSYQRPLYASKGGGIL